LKNIYLKIRITTFKANDCIKTTRFDINTNVYATYHRLNARCLPGFDLL